MKKLFSSSYMAIILMLIYIPIFVLIVMSFNSGSSMSIFQGFSDRWYKELAKQTPFVNSIIVSIFVAVIATIISTIIGTMAAIGISKSRKLTQKMTLSITNIPLVNADVVTAVALMLLFLALSVNFGIVTLVLAHISFDIPYVIITILPRLRKIDNSLIDASLDLGAKPSQTMRKIVLPILKPAIIAAAAIAFAMSFDDFIISYFTGGDQVNVATFIYTLKRLKPYVNAFGTIWVLVIGAIIFAWNIYNLIKSQSNKLKTDLLKGTYRDKALYNLELKLIIYYRALNFKDEQRIWFFQKFWLHFRIRFITWFYRHKMISTVELYRKLQELQAMHLERFRAKMRRKIIKIEAKQDYIINWIIDKKAKFEQKQEDVEEWNKTMRVRFRWLARTWKPVSLTAIIIAAVALLTGFYILNNSFDLSVANWGEYINNDIINDFDAKYGVKVKYNVYDSNETLYNKLYTTNYDVMVPSDYMVKKLAMEGALQPIDYSLLNKVDSNYFIYKPAINAKSATNEDFIDTTNQENVDHYAVDKANNVFADYKKRSAINDKLVQQEWFNSWVSKDKKSHNILEYSIPYFWGDIELVVNPTQIGWLKKQGIEVNDDLSIANPEKLGWDILWKAANAGKNVLLNDDYKNLFMIANERNFQTVLPTSQDQIDADFDNLHVLLSHKNVALLNDEIINRVGDNQFDFAFMYNGDAIYADNSVKHDAKSYRMVIAHPRMQHANGKQEGTNIWSDNIVISSKTSHQQLAYQFINFIIQHYADISDYTGYTSPMSQVIDYATSKTYSDYKRVYTPVSQFVNGKYVISPLPSDGPFLMSDLDAKMVDDYNILISQKN